MKTILKSFFFTILIVSFFSCENNNDSNGGSEEELGWVQFRENTADLISVNQGFTDEITLDINIQVPTTNSDLTVNYDLVSISGLDPNTIFSSSIVIPAGETSWSGPDNNTGIDYANFGEIKFDLSKLPTLITPMEFDVVLTGTSSSLISAGLAGEDHKTIQKICIGPINPSTSFTGDGYSNELEVSAETFPPLTVDLVPISGETNTWTLVTTWGPDFVNLLTGGNAAPGSFPYPSTISILEDGSVLVTGDEFYTSGGTGSYNGCSDTFSLNLTQTLFNGTFTVDVILIGNGD